MNIRANLAHTKDQLP